MKTVDYEAKIKEQSESLDVPLTAPEFGTSGTKTDSAAATVAWRVWDSRRSIGKKIGIFLALVTVAVFIIPTSYESTTTLMPPDNNGMDFPLALGGIMDKGGGNSGGGGGGSASMLGGLAGSLLGLKNQSDVFIGVLQSDTIANRLIDRFDLRRVYSVKYYAEARITLQSRSTITSDRKSGIISITVSDHQAQRAEQLAQAYVEELDHVMARVSTSAAGRERVFLEARLKQVKADLDDASRELAEFSSKNTTLDMDEQAKAMVEAQSSLAGQLIAAQSALAGLQQVYSDNNVRVKSMKAEIADLTDKIAKVGGVAGNSGGTIPGLGSPTIRALPLVGVRFEDLYRNAKIQEKIFEVLTQECELAKVQEAKDLPSVKVLDPAAVPEHRSWPPRGRILAISAVLGFFFAVGWVWAEYRWDQMDENSIRKVTLLEFRALGKTMWQWLVDHLRKGVERFRNRSGPDIAKG